jgi:hypothetical protein
MVMNGATPMWGEYYMYSVKFTALPAGFSGLQYSDSEIRIDSDADFNFVKTMYYSTNDLPEIKARYRDDSTGRFLTKNASRLRNIAGRSLPIDNSGSYDFRPFIWPVPYTIRRATTFLIALANEHAVIVPDVYITFHGAKIWPGIAPWKETGLKMPFVYSPSRSSSTLPEGIVQIPANGSITATISIDKDSDFVLNKLTGSAQGDALVTVQEMGRDRQWMNTATHIRNLIGGGWSPNILPAPRFLAAGSVVSVTLQDLSGFTNNIEFNLIGVKIFSKR